MSHHACGKILALVDDQHVVFPRVRQLGGGQRPFHLGPHRRRAVVGCRALRAQERIAQHVEVGDAPALRHQLLDVVGQRPVVADVQRPPAGLDRGAVFGQRQLRLAAAGGADHAQPERGKFEPARPQRQAAGDARDQGFGAADHRAGIRGQIQHLAQIARHAPELRRFLGDRQQAADGGGQLSPLAGIDDARRLDAGQVRIFDPVIRAVQQVVDLQRLLRLRRKALAQAIDHAQDLDANVLRLVLVILDQSFRRFGQEAGLLLDQQDATVGRDDDEVDFSVGGKALFDIRPVHAVVDVIGRVGQRRIQHRQRFDFARGGAGDGHFAPAGRIDLGHGGRRTKG